VTKFATVIFCIGAVLTVAYVRSDSVGGGGSIGGTGQAFEILNQEGRNERAMFLVGADRLELPKGDPKKIKSLAEFKKYLADNRVKAHDDAFKPQEKRFADAVGEKYDEHKLAAEARRIGMEFPE
jgi:hypothetical protein